ncbi:MAG: 5-oxoprolinase subunit PxpB [Gemmatimonadota bacterium]|nr:5-oxoprolinase subunit PxpB [Gemmatimonadota bacterium]
MSVPVIEPLGDSAVIVTFGSEMDRGLNELVARRAESIRAAHVAGVTDVVASYASLGVFFNPGDIRFETVRDYVWSVMSDEAKMPPPAPRSGKLVRIPTKYDGADLDWVAERTGLPRHEVVDIHSAVEYRVLVIGFVPGFAYLGDLDARLHLPRRDAPRKRVNAGSVAIAEFQTGIYPSNTPGGWHLIGSTAESMFDARRDPPALLAVGDTVIFEPL